MEYDSNFIVFVTLNELQAHMIKILESEVNRLKNKARFIKMKIDHNLEFEGLSRVAIIDLLEANNFERFVDDKDTGDDEDSHNGHGYDYLMKSPAWSFCKEEVSFQSVFLVNINDIVMKTYSFYIRHKNL